MNNPPTQARLVLASQSPRRLDLLTSAGFEPIVLATECDERLRSGETPADYVIRLADTKCEAGVARARTEYPDDNWVVLAADTIVVAPGGQIFGKPENVAEAGAMLACLMDATHEVLTAFTLACGDKRHNEYCCTRVTMGSISTAAAAAYWLSGEPCDKAGGYAIQGLGSIFVTTIDGSYSNVVGLPVAQCVTALSEVGVQPNWQRKVVENG